MLDTSQVKQYYNKEDRTAYEESRWASSPVAKGGYILTKDAIERYVLPHVPEVKEYLELGPGPGTWTKVLAGRMSGASLHLVDISRAMLESAKKNLADIPSVTYTESDFLQFTPEKMYDLFFSSRAIEYFPDKKQVVEKILKTVRPGGEVFLITKTPHYLRMKMLGKQSSSFHQGQISPRELSKIFSDFGGKILEIRPVFVVIPMLHSPALNALATRFLRLLPWNRLTQAISESYLIRARKT